jgi:PHD/YefM family antitoxin component YafN of YafNO toxin-antitoxin module
MQKVLELPKVEFITTAEGKPKSVVLSLEDWKKVVETLRIMTSKELIQSIKVAKRQLRSGTKLLSSKEVFENL